MKRAVGIIIVLTLLAGLILFWYHTSSPGKNYPAKSDIINLFTTHEPSTVEKIPPDKLTTPDLILLGARQEVKNATRYDASYQVMPYPGGDVDKNKGACTDVVVRALRHAGIDLQELMHEDMKINFSAYPDNWGLASPDPNIDHRRVPNQMTFFKRHGLELSKEVQGNLAEWQWGDVVYWRFADGNEHCGIISDRSGNHGIPLVIHNASIAKEEDCLLSWEITGHYRFPTTLQP